MSEFLVHFPQFQEPILDKCTSSLSNELNSLPPLLLDASLLACDTIIAHIPAVLTSIIASVVALEIDLITEGDLGNLVHSW